MRYSAAIDLSGPELLLALADSSGRVVCEAAEPLRGRDSARLASVVEAALGRGGAAVSDVGHWTVGSGPGNFSGLRIAAALVEGIIFDTAAQARCVPSALAIAAPVCGGAEGEAAVLFDGRNNELLLYGLTCRGGRMTPSGRTAILKREEINHYLNSAGFAVICALEREREALEKLLPDGVKVEYAAKPAAAELLKPEHGEFDGRLAELIYIRPSVTSKQA